MVSGSPEVGSEDQPAPENVVVMDLREASSSLAAIQVIHPRERAIGPSGRAKNIRAGCKRPLLSDWMVLNSYLSPRDLAPPMEEVSAPRPEGVQGIIDRWRPFNQGEPAADHMHDLYLTMLRIPVAVRADGQGEEYSVPVPGGTTKEDLLQMIEDGMQACNRSFDQSTELVSL